MHDRQQGEFMSITRRDLLKFGAGAAAMSAVGVVPSMLRANQAGKKIPIALELYSIRDVAPKDVPAAFEAVAKMGYEGIEFAGYYGMKAQDLRKLLDKNNLKCCGTHTGLDTLTGDALKATIEFNQVVGNKYLIVPWLPLQSLAVIMDTAKKLTDLAGKAKESGMRVGYHAHGSDFKAVADRIPWDVLFTNTSPDVVMQLDVGNCIDGGGDPVAIIKKYPNRSKTIHLKEHGGTQGAAVGEGDVPWKEVFAACETVGGTDWYIVEQEAYRTSSMESVKQCLENLRKMGK
jgi:sugar phosphate isomerase/epimerase